MTGGQRQGLTADLIAGVSVALVLVPQSMAYAVLAGLPAWHGLYAAAVAPVLAAPFASSRYLQTGPVALTSLLTIGALGTMAAVGSDNYVALAALLALVVGVTRLAIGALRAGAVAWLMSRPVLRGFTAGAALLICASQLPAALGLVAEGESILKRTAWTLSHPEAWVAGAVVLSVATAVAMRGGRRIHRLFPGVLVAVVVGLLASVVGLPVGPTIGEVPSGLPHVALDLPWSELGALVLPGVVIALIGFAEPAAIARTFAAKDREAWDPNREFVSQGVANIAAGLFAGFPVGGSFARSSIAKEAGGRTRVTGAVAGATVLLVLPFAGLLAPLPQAVLGAIVLTAVAPLMDPRPLLRLWKQSRPQALVGWTTFAATILAAPKVQYGVIAGISLAAAVHLWREMELGVEVERRGDMVHLRPSGVLWFGSAAVLEQACFDARAAHSDAEHIVVDLAGLGRVDLSGAAALSDLLCDAAAAGFEVTFDNVPTHAQRILQRVCPDADGIRAAATPAAPPSDASAPSADSPPTRGTPPSPR